MGEKIFEYKPGDLALDQYRIIKEINRGGMNSIIYLAEDINVPNEEYFTIKNKKVIIKLIYKTPDISESDWEKYYHEYITASRVSGRKNIINTYERQENKENGTFVIAMEYINGNTLKKYLEKNGHLTVSESIYIIKCIVNAVVELHYLKDKIIHRDLKPENILLSNDLITVKLIDFGISSVKGRLANKNNMLQTNEDAIFGTYPYLSPSVLELKVNIDEKKKAEIINEQLDFYSIGVIFYQLLTGEFPFYAKDYENKDVIKLPLVYDVLPLSTMVKEIPPSIDNIIYRCLSCKKDDKKYQYANAKELLNDIENIFKNKDQELIKPYEKRILQMKNSFNVLKEKNREKFYESYWFISIITVVTLVIVICIAIFLFV
jgi:serine/threonine-protein kinase